MVYVALLRGINVGGKSLIKMSELKEAFEKCGMENVRTFINSGNVIFEADQKDIEKVTNELEKSVLKTFRVDSKIVVVSQSQLNTVLASAPKEWKEKDKFRCYIAFIKTPYNADDVTNVVRLREGIDSIQKGPGVVYMSTLLSGITKTGFTKLATQKIYKYLTIRNLTTVQKIQVLMEQ